MFCSSSRGCRTCRFCFKVWRERQRSGRGRAPPVLFQQQRSSWRSSGGGTRSNCCWGNSGRKNFRLRRTESEVDAPHLRLLPLTRVSRRFSVCWTELHRRLQQIQASLQAHGSQTQQLQQHAQQLQQDLALPAPPQAAPAPGPNQEEVLKPLQQELQHRLQQAQELDATLSQTQGALQAAEQRLQVRAHTHTHTTQ